MTATSEFGNSRPWPYEELEELRARIERVEKRLELNPLEDPIPGRVLDLLRRSPVPLRHVDIAEALEIDQGAAWRACNGLVKRDLAILHEKRNEGSSRTFYKYSAKLVES
jgi:hypothetical protein